MSSSYQPVTQIILGPIKEFLPVTADNRMLAAGASYGFKNRKWKKIKAKIFYYHFPELAIVYFFRSAHFGLE
jgi:hypothetical protein